MIKYHEKDYGSIVVNKFRDYLWGDKKVEESTIDACCISVRAFCNFSGIRDEESIKTIDGRVVRSFVEHLRHYFALKFIEIYGEDALSVLADILGHKSIETTRIYLTKTLSELSDKMTIDSLKIKIAS